MKIKCPECEASLSIGAAKPGRYRPKCKHCHQPFTLKVTDDEPPKFVVRRHSESKAKQKVVPQSNAPQQDVAATMDSSQKARPTSANAERETIKQRHGDPAKKQRPDTSAVEATMDSVARSGLPSSDLQATLDTAIGPSSGGAQTVDGDAGATVDTTINSQADAAKPQRSRVSKGGSGSGAVVSRGSAAKSRTSQSGNPHGAEEPAIPERLGGYRILRLLGRGAMGAVYEAKQNSLDRLVALKTIRSRLANNPSSLARFTREAYAAAQLTHHNVVQIYDFGEDEGRHFFSMEWVRGGPLSDLVAGKGPIDARRAAGYVLQAARGLQFAHRNGMVHRDIKPANLLLSDEGVVKVADLGLVKVPDHADPDSDVGAASGESGFASGTQVTMQGTAVGTPAYMAPEQSIDAAGVDHRADIYSLGATLFYLLAGKPPFEGSIVSDVLHRHATEPLPDLVKINSRVPVQLKDIVERSMAKQPSGRYGSISDMIDELEAFLGISSDGGFSPTSEQADKWEAFAKQYASATTPLALTKPILAAFTAVCVLLTLVTLVTGLSWMLLGPSIFVAGITTSLALGVGSGSSAIVTSVRRWISSLTWFDYFVAAVGTLVFLLVIFIAGFWPGVLVGTILGSICGAGYHFGIVAPSRKKATGIVMHAERFVRDLRIDGADEDGLRNFAARYSGNKWQGLFEAIFGYASLCKVREQLLGDPSVPAGSTKTTIRDKICLALDAKAAANKEARDHKRLTKIEQRGLQSEGVSASKAAEQAWQMAAAVMDNAKLQPIAAQDPKAAADEKREKMKAMMADARSGKYKRKRSLFAPIGFALGGPTRFLAGCLLLALFAPWAQETGALDAAKESIAAGSIDTASVTSLVTDSSASGKTIMGFNGWSVGLAGLLVVLSSFVSGWRMTPVAIIAVVVILMGPSFGIPGFRTLIQPWMVSALAGMAVMVTGSLFAGSNKT